MEHVNCSLRHKTVTIFTTTIMTHDKQTTHTDSNSAGELLISNFRDVSHWSWRRTTATCRLSTGVDDWRPPRRTLRAWLTDVPILMMPPIKYRSPPWRWPPRSSAAGSAYSVETLGVVIDNWIQSSTNTAAAAAAAVSASDQQWSAVGNSVA